MAAIRLQVDLGGGKKEVTNVGPNTTMQAVINDVCQRRGLDPTRFSLKHKRSVLDNSLTVRFSGLSSNAMLELVAATPSAISHGSCNIALQLENGERKTISVDTSTLLSQAIMLRTLC